jgi:hypothetical protein
MMLHKLQICLAVTFLPACLSAQEFDTNNLQHHQGIVIYVPSPGVKPNGLAYIRVKSQEGYYYPLVLADKQIVKIHQDTIVKWIKIEDIASASLSSGDNALLDQLNKKIDQYVEEYPRAKEVFLTVKRYNQNDKEQLRKGLEKRRWEWVSAREAELADTKWYSLKLRSGENIPQAVVERIIDTTVSKDEFQFSVKTPSGSRLVNASDIPSQYWPGVDFEYEGQALKGCRVLSWDQSKAKLVHKGGILSVDIGTLNDAQIALLSKTHPDFDADATASIASKTSATNQGGNSSASSSAILDAIGEIASLTTLSGSKYENVKVRKIEPDGITIFHSGGAEKVYYKDLSDEWRKKLGHNDQEEKAYYAKKEQVKKEQLQREKAELQKLDNMKQAEKEKALSRARICRRYGINPHVFIGDSLETARAVYSEYTESVFEIDDSTDKRRNSGDKVEHRFTKMVSDDYNFDWTSIIYNKRTKKIEKISIEYVRNGKKSPISKEHFASFLKAQGEIGTHWLPCDDYGKMVSYNGERPGDYYYCWGSKEQKAYIFWGQDWIFAFSKDVLDSFEGKKLMILTD